MKACVLGVYDKATKGIIFLKNASLSFLITGITLYQWNYTQQICPPPEIRLAGDAMMGL